MIGQRFSSWVTNERLPRLTSTGRVLLTIIVLQAVLCPAALYFAATHHPDYHFVFQRSYLGLPFLALIAFAFLGIGFTVPKFSLGYVLSYNSYLMIMGFLWINQFTTFEYNYFVAGASAVVSLMCFAAPALLINTRMDWDRTFSIRAADVSVIFLMTVCVVIIVAGYSYSFHLLDLTRYTDIRDELLRTAALRNSINLPKALGYAVGICSTTIVPFAFAFWLERKRFGIALAALLLLAAFFPITLTKSSLFSPFWLVFLAVLASVFSARTACVLAMLIPMTLGIFALCLFPAKGGGDVFDLLVFRLFAIPSASLSVYNDYFARHDLTAFCQIGVVAKVFGCNYEELGSVMAATYRLGHYNASLFATEGIASIGTALAPISSLICGLVIAGANRLSAGLPPRFILVSSGMLVGMFLNVPFSILMVTHGAVVLFLLWPLTPRDLLAKGML